MDDALRKRLDAIVGLLAVVAVLLVAVVVAVGGTNLLAFLGVAGGLAAVVLYSLYEDRPDREAEVGDPREE